MAATQGLEVRELSLIDKVELRIALADSNTKLQSVLNTYLAPLLLKLASEHLNVRNKVISICQHLNTRIKPVDVRLPVSTLLKQFKDNRHSPLIRHFDLLYIQQGYDRLQTSEISELFPLLIHDIASDASTSAAHGAIVFHLFLRSLGMFTLPLKGSEEDVKLPARLNATNADIEFLSTWIGKLIIFRAVLPSSGVVSRDSNSHPGLSAGEYAFLTLHGKPDTWEASNHSGMSITEAKIRTLNLLASGLFDSSSRFFPALYASADQNSKIADVGEDLLKRSLPNMDLEDERIVTKLYNVYLGGYAAIQSNPSDTVIAARTPLRTRILAVLSRTSVSTTFPRKIVAIVQKDLARNGQNIQGETQKTDRETLKLKSTIISFLSFVARRASPEDLDVIARPIIVALKDFLEHQEAEHLSLDEKSVRSSIYEIIGHIAGAHKQILFDSNLSLLRWLFQSLYEERQKDVLVSIDEALSATLRCFQEALSTEVEGALRQILMSAITQESRNTRNVRYAAVRFANRCLAYNDVVARWIDLVVIAQSDSESHETIEEAKKGLDPYWYRLFHSTDDSVNNMSCASDASVISARSDFPSFIELVTYIFGEAIAVESEVSLNATAVSYCRQALIWESLEAQGQTIQIDSEWERKLDLAAAQDQKARDAIRRYVKTFAVDSAAARSILVLWRAALQCMNSNQMVADQVTCARVAFELCTLSPSSIIVEAPEALSVLQSNLLGYQSELRTLAAQTYGVLASFISGETDDLVRSLHELMAIVTTWKNAVGAQVNKVHGATLGLATFVSYRKYYNIGDEVAERTLSRFLPTLVNMLEQASEPMIYQAAYVAFGQLCKFYALTPQEIAALMPPEDLAEKITKRAKVGDEKAINALGQVSLIFSENENDGMLNNIVEHIHSLHEIRQAETQFAVGEALTCAACGWDSKGLMLNIEGPPPTGPMRQTTLVAVVDRVLKDSKTTKPALKKAAIIWLLCFIQFCGDRTEIKERLRSFQAAFKLCLSDRDELVQEAASRGLSLVYELGTKEVKEDLVKDLIGSFSSDRANIAGTVTNDTQLFESGALPVGEGSSITTYKDIMSLASEVGDSSLTYRFMALASNNAIWSSRAAFGRFGLSNVLSDSGYLSSNPKLYPKLFRYRFDPNTNVRRSMNDIWNALVKDSTATVDAHFETIMEDLLVTIISREWRTREASCAAIADLVQGRKMATMGPFLDRTWAMCFKVLDDIKQSVRTAAAALARTLIGILVRSLESSDGNSQETTRILNVVLPFLLSTSGIESSAKEVQTISLYSLLEIIKKGRAVALNAFIPQLVESLLGLLTSLEPQQINSIYLNASKYGLTEQIIDKDRETSISGSPLMDAVERCVDMVSNDSMPKLVISLQKAMHSAVGMPSKIGCSRVLISLSTRRNFLFRTHADQFVDAILKYISDRNEAVCSSYATALGYVVRVSTDQSLLKIASYAHREYFGSEEARARVIVGEAVRAVGKHASDRFAGLASAFLPLVFIARHDGELPVRKLFQEVWDDNTGGPRAASLYLREIATLAQEHLTSKRWILKHAAALSIAELAEAVVQAQGRIGSAEGEILWPVLEKALAEKSWDGKEKVLEGFAKFVKGAQAFWSPRAGVHEAIRKIATREARRRNEHYRQFALGSLGDVAACFEEDDSFANEVIDIIQPVFEELTDGSTTITSISTSTSIGTHTSDTAREQGEQDRDTLHMTLVAGTRSLFAAGGVSGREARQRVLRVLGLALLAARAPQHAGGRVGTNAVHMAIFEGLKALIGKVLATPALRHHIFVHVAMPLPATTFSSACAHLLLPDVYHGSALGAAAELDFGVGSLGSLGTGTGPARSSGVGPVDGDGDMPEAVRVVRSEALLNFARLVCQQFEPPSRDQPPVIEGVARLFAAEKSLVARNNLGQAMRILSQKETASGS